MTDCLSRHGQAVHKSFVMNSGDGSSSTKKKNLNTKLFQYKHEHKNPWMQAWHIATNDVEVSRQKLDYALCISDGIT